MKKYLLLITALISISCSSNYAMYLNQESHYECTKMGIQLLVKSRFNNVSSIEIKEHDKDIFESLEILDIQRSPILGNNTIITNKGTLFIPGISLGSAKWNDYSLKKLEDSTTSTMIKK